MKIKSFLPLITETMIVSDEYLIDRELEYRNSPDCDDFVEGEEEKTYDDFIWDDTEFENRVAETVCFVVEDFLNRELEISVKIKFRENYWKYGVFQQTTVEFTLSQKTYNKVISLLKGKYAAQWLTYVTAAQENEDHLYRQATRKGDGTAADIIRILEENTYGIADIMFAYALECLCIAEGLTYQELESDNRLVEEMNSIHRTDKKIVTE